MKYLIAVLGTHGSGKTEICQKTSSLICRDFPDLAVFSVNKKSSVPRSLAESTALYQNVDHKTQVEICFKVLTGAMQALISSDIVFVDRLLIDSIAYIRTAEKVDQSIIASLDGAVRFFDQLRDVALTVAVPAPDFPLPKDDFRDEDEEYRRLISRLVTRELIGMGIPFIYLQQQTLQERVEYLHSRITTIIKFYKEGGE
jgi:uridine kinase